ncbi:MAG: hypothetical protein Harvfovirus14_13 [Harvfovirus sp.]|uniref:Uncharacterized protein n=1 Tax=Harvfovirus sp. TaxID=2487768 RepID=A0A3G5A1G4_9VIRU|nr:MAG: hypothetical protein Harvfovirus14_13 [Harvfovirus sp.]
MSGAVNVESPKTLSEAKRLLQIEIDRANRLQREHNEAKAEIASLKNLLIEEKKKAGWTDYWKGNFELMKDTAVDLDEKLKAARIQGEKDRTAFGPRRETSTVVLPDRVRFQYPF